ncbi:hypothetical protein [Rhizobium sp. PDO1-076]|uniref:hypothetical protein n=1 Tax=Rhizobium sp. PDO1-076 TaxID=1125979 RepID=UPI001146AC79|nr:hypothetical protein [Rhizobium sp. PDO1-076]
MVLLQIANPSKRLGGLSPKDAALYNAGGDLIVVRASGGIEVKAASSFTCTIGGLTFTITNAGVDIDGGYLKVNGVRVDDTHTHGGIVEGSGFTEVPVS